MIIVSRQKTEISKSFPQPVAFVVEREVFLNNTAQLIKHGNIWIQKIEEIKERPEKMKFSSAPLDTENALKMWMGNLSTLPWHLSERWSRIESNGWLKTGQDPGPMQHLLAMAISYGCKDIEKLYDPTSPLQFYFEANREKARIFHAAYETEEALASRNKLGRLVNDFNNCVLRITHHLALEAASLTEKEEGHFLTWAKNLYVALNRFKEIDKIKKVA